MKSVSLQLNDKTYKDAEEILAETKADRDGYFNEAIEHYNALKKREVLAAILKRESEMVREESMRVLAEFENLADDDSSI